MPPWTKNLVALTALVALAGCGGSTGGGPGGGGGGGDQEDAVRSVLTNLQAASRQGNGNRICNQIFTPKLADSVTSSSKSGSCAKEVKAKVFSPEAKITVEDVTVSDAANAKATIKEQNGKTSSVFLVKQGDEWRVRSVKPA
ncbi:MAG: hypothetical protein LC808_29210 [Actinobacteria bacterium]|nr:hypothetical protein [Actinomycetota bacterium]